MAEDYCGKIGADFCVVTNADGRWIGRRRRPRRREADALVAVIERARQGQAAPRDPRAGRSRLLSRRRAGAVRSETRSARSPRPSSSTTRSPRELALMARCDVTFLCGDGRCLRAVRSREEQRAAVMAIVRAGSARAPQPDTPRCTARPRRLRRRDVSRSATLTRGSCCCRIGRRPNGRSTRFTTRWSGSGHRDVRHRRRRHAGVRPPLTRPLRDLADAANDLAGGNWTRRVPVEGPAEAPSDGRSVQSR